MKKDKYDLGQAMADLNLLDDAIEGVVVPGGSSTPLNRIKNYTLGTFKSGQEVAPTEANLKATSQPVHLPSKKCPSCGEPLDGFWLQGDGKVDGVGSYRASHRKENTCNYLGPISDSIRGAYDAVSPTLLPSSLTFRALREANIARLPEFKNANGRPAHEEEDGSDWSPAQWLQAVVGELGEYANIRKKFERGDIDLEEFKELSWKELADVQCYLDILARRCLDSSEEIHPTGIDLGQAVIDKFNLISERVGSTVRLGTEGWYRNGGSDV